MLQPTNNLMSNHDHGNRHQPTATPLPSPARSSGSVRHRMPVDTPYFHVSRAGPASLVPPWNGKILQPASFPVLAVLFRKR
jgi:hypothetical protein